MIELNYDKIREHIKNIDDSEDKYISNEEIDLIVTIGERQKTENSNVGYRVDRIKNNEREKAFHDHWLKENEINSHINSGNGILQDLFIEHENPAQWSSRKKWVVDINERDRMIVATVIQWLGSNVGFSFLHETLKDFGYIITEKK